MRWIFQVAVIVAVVYWLDSNPILGPGEIKRSGSSLGAAAFLGIAISALATWSIGAAIHAKRRWRWFPLWAAGAVAAICVLFQATTSPDGVNWPAAYIGALVVAASPWATIALMIWIPILIIRRRQELSGDGSAHRLLAIGLRRLFGGKQARDPIVFTGTKLLANRRQDARKLIGHARSRPGRAIVR